MTWVNRTVVTSSTDWFTLVSVIRVDIQSLQLESLNPVLRFCRWRTCVRASVLCPSPTQTSIPALQHNASKRMRVSSTIMQMTLHHRLKADRATKPPVGRNGECRLIVETWLSYDFVHKSRADVMLTKAAVTFEKVPSLSATRRRKRWRQATANPSVPDSRAMSHLQTPNTPPSNTTHDLDRILPTAAIK